MRQQASQHPYEVTGNNHETVHIAYQEIPPPPPLEAILSELEQMINTSPFAEVLGGLQEALTVTWCVSAIREGLFQNILLYVIQII